MGNVSSPDGNPERVDGSPIEYDDIGFDEHPDDVASLLEDNARLRELVVKLSEIILRNVVDGQWQTVADP